MIKTIYKKTFASFVVLGVLFSGNALAVGGNGTTGGANENSNAKQTDTLPKKDDRTTSASANMCEKISERANAFGQKMTDEENKFQTRVRERATNWKTKETENEAKLTALRTTWDANRDAQFKALEAKATTDAQKQAVSSFEVQVRTAIQTRRGAMDGAIKTFQTGVQAAIATRQGQTDQLLSSMKSSRQTLLDTAKADCATGKDAKTVMATFRSGMQANRTKIQADKQNVAKINSTVTALIATRKQTMEKATADFKAIMEQARVTLKKAFDNSAN